MNEKIHYWIQQFEALLLVLASDSEVQKQYLEKIGASPSADELALELDDMMWLLDESSKENTLSGEFIESVRKIDLAFSKMSDANNELIWRVNALDDFKEWENIRLLAKNALSLLNK